MNIRITEPGIVSGTLEITLDDGDDLAVTCDGKRVTLELALFSHQAWALIDALSAIAELTEAP